MNRLLQLLGQFGQVLQNHLFPALTEELGPMSNLHRELAATVAMLEMDGFVSVRHGRGRPAYSRVAIARAFVVAKTYPTVNAYADFQT